MIHAHLMAGMTARAHARRGELKTRIRALERLVLELSSRIECLEDHCAELTAKSRGERAWQVLHEMAHCGQHRRSAENSTTLRRLEKELEALSDPLHVDTSFEIEERSPMPHERPQEAKTPLQ